MYLTFNFKFRFATGFDYFLIVIALIAAAGIGASQPLMFLVFGEMTDSFVDLGKLAMCYNTSEAYSPQICKLAMMTLSEGRVRY